MTELQPSKFYTVDLWALHIIVIKGGSWWYHEIEAIPVHFLLMKNLVSALQ